MALTVRAAVAVEAGKTELRELAAPSTSETSGLLKVAVTGVCGSDWPYYQQLPPSRGPLVLGHETVGHVAELGDVARAKWGVQEGDLVALEEYLPCGHCEFCRSGEFRLCDATDWRLGGLRYGATGLSVAPGLWGGFSQYQYLHLNTVFHRVPSGVSPRHAALALPLANGIEWTYLQGGAGPGQTVLIQGPGQQGLSCVVAAREAGAERIIVTGLSNETDARRLALARELGAHYTIDIESQDLLETVADLTGGQMADLVIDCAAGGTESVGTAIQLARKRGRVILGGQKRRRIPEFDSDRIIARFLTVKGMRGHSYESVELALQLIAGDRHGVRQMSTHAFGLEDTDLALRSLAGQGVEGAIHMTIDPWN
ncbi:alcohol dehydrogenase [Pigmentiphaga sp. NML080357]|uniref:zinc-dependent alcohol dehydrogenase n=1 Tax=Pigmentiphaga sp. NML080357 TaxID=2008675 RepID=UPI000B41C51D|nr:zinc-binding dehydrogenase [Pigmentiphaga sp. NML080357]OVZ55133.1 alcohol dehydrogenase [Pigmentiphaga sp. NML080357]